MRTLRAIALSLVAASAVTAVGGCKRQSDETQRRLDQLSANIDSIERRVDAVARMAGAAPRPTAPPPGPRPGEPDPAATYAVDVTGDPFEGPADALITIIEAFEFA
ncbi:MAG: hypothetical protein EXR73_06945 [Myxococcales bacterium]|nr:hypothetical protein [Myxococcales bacterium]